MLHYNCWRIIRPYLCAICLLFLQRSLSNTEDECTHLKDMCEVSQKELQELAEKHQEQLTEMAAIQKKLEVIEENMAMA